MPLVPLSDQPAAPVVVSATETTQPMQLSPTEKWLAGLLMGAGVVMIVVLLSAFMARGQAWSLTSKETTETTAATSSAAEKKINTVEYSDSVLIAGMSLGAVFLLTGAFFGRIREITLPGGAVLKVGDLPPEKEKELKDVISKKATEKAGETAGQVTPEALAEEAVKQAGVVFHDQYWGAVPRPSTEDLEQIAEKALDRAGKVLAAS